jgi:pyruvate/2-oxoglutarate dehydrogenase complex dihydrolipoamide dehydrogenase (E3) component
MLVIGAGAGGLVTAAGSRAVGAKVGIIERKFMGGDCLNFGCVPSKAFIAAANVAHTCRVEAKKFGIEVGEVKVNFGKVMERMRKIRAEIAENDSVERFNNFLGADTYLGCAKFLSPHTVQINGHVLHFHKCTIATGGRPALPLIPGLITVPYYTSDTIFNLTQQPKRLLIIGSGPVGCELGQAFQRLGTQVHMIERGGRFMPREDTDAAQLLMESLTADGVHIHLKAKVKLMALEREAEEGEFPEIAALVEREDGREYDLFVDCVLLAVGRKPNMDNLNLEAAGVKHNPHGVEVDQYLQTSNPNVYAVGDCIDDGRQFTHHSDIHARYVVRNALFGEHHDRTKVFLPWCTYTEPEIAHVGYYPRQLDYLGIKFDTYFKFMDKLDRALCEGKYGIMKIHTQQGTDEILGATLVGGSAGDMISQITSAMFNGVGLSKMGGCVFPYPTYAESFRHLSDQFNRKRLVPLSQEQLDRLRKKVDGGGD